jgi:hypothetical protein
MVLQCETKKREWFADGGENTPLGNKRRKDVFFLLPLFFLFYLISFKTFAIFFLILSKILKLKQI